MKGLNYRYIAAAAAAVFYALAGCGGCGSSIGTGYSDPPTPVDPVNFVPTGPGVPGGTSTKPFAAGNSFVYEVQGTITKDVTVGGSTTTVNSNVTGTDTITFTMDYNTSAAMPFPMLKMTEKLTYIASSLSNLPIVEITEVYYVLENDSLGNPCYVEKGRRDLDLITFSNESLPAIPTTWSRAANTGGKLTFTATDKAYTVPGHAFASTTEVSTALAVLGEDVLTSTVSGAPFYTWKCSKSEHSIVNIDVRSILPPYGNEELWDGFVMRRERQLDGTEWWSPSIATYAKRNLTINDTMTVLTSWSYTPASSGTPESWTLGRRTEHATLNLSMVLRSYNVN